MNALHHRLATRDDIVVLTALMNASIGELQKPFLTDAQIASSRAIMGLDTQLIDDGTYFVVEQDGLVAGCGGWSRRATLYGVTVHPGAMQRRLTRRRMPRACVLCIHAPNSPAEGWDA
jgi:hypothetical protein